MGEGEGTSLSAVFKGLGLGVRWVRVKGRHYPLYLKELALE